VVAERARTIPDCLTYAELEETISSGRNGKRSAAALHLSVCESCRRRADEIRANNDFARTIRSLGHERVEQALATRESQPGSADAHSSRPLNANALRPGAPEISGYDLVAEVHRGAQGVVYRAVQQSTRRTVALKVPGQGPYASRRQRRRFEREIDLVAALDHPNIVTLFDSGSARGQHYFAMQYIDGLRVHDYVTVRRLSLRRTLRLFAKICRAVSYAHQHGIIHRDLKPGNILVSDDGEPHVLDFGLAKAAETGTAAGRSAVTVTGDFLGTLVYAAPEQVSGDPNEVDTRTDVYALGVMLHELLTGRHPYRTDGPMSAVLHNITQVDPAPLSSDRRTIPDEAETIVRKALAKDKARRYQSAGALADDIDHYLAGEPIDAKRDSATYVLKKTLARHRLLVATVGVVFGIVAAAAVVSTTAWRRAATDRDKATAAERSAATERDRAIASEQVAERHRADAVLQAETLRRTLYLSRIALAQNAYDSHDMRRFRQLLDECPPELRAWEWQRLRWLADRSVRTLRGHSGLIRSVTVRPHGQIIASGGNDAKIRIWDAGMGRHLWTLDGQGGPVTAVLIAPDGQTLVSGHADRQTRVWDVWTGALVRTLPRQLSTPRRLAFSSDGRWFAVGGNEPNLIGVVEVWDTSTGEKARTLGGKARELVHVAFWPDGSRLAACYVDGTILSWNAETGQPQPGPPAEPHGIWSIAVSPDGRQFASAGDDGVIKVLDIATWSELRTLRGHVGRVDSVAFYSEGRRLISCGADRTVRTWDVDAGGQIAAYRGHTEHVPTPPTMLPTTP